MNFSCERVIGSLPDAAHSTNITTPPRTTSTSAPGTGGAPTMIASPTLETLEPTWTSVTCSGGGSTATTTRRAISATRVRGGDRAGATQPVITRMDESTKPIAIVVTVRVIHCLPKGSDHTGNGNRETIVLI